MIPEERAETRADIFRLSKAINAYPAAFRGNQLNLLFLNDAHPIYDSRDFLRQIDSLKLQQERREFLLGKQEGWPFPTIRIDDRPDPWAVSEALFEHFGHAGKILPTQGDIGRILVDEALKDDSDVVLLMIVDGLSYYDLPEEIEAMPCFVSGVSITDFGFREVIGKPSVSQRLFSQGYRNQVALTFFAKDSSPLSAELHSTFGASQLNRITSLAEGMAIINSAEIWRGYVQIVAPGLDKLSHYHADRPLIKGNINRILERQEKVIDCLSKKGRKVLACLASDHGILWREQAEDKTQIAADLFSEDIKHPRYLKGSLNRSYAKAIKCGSNSFTLLRAPFLTRNWKHSEWGVHGGISAWESIIPVIMRKN
jgi:hypothetical protein